jgi:hypothetical protein
MASSADDPRISRLSKLFNEVVCGRKTLDSSRSGKLFIEAICAREDRAACIHRLLSNQPGLVALQACVRFDTSPSFINENAIVLLQYLQLPSLETIDSGLALGKILLSIVDPPYFWDAFTKAFRDKLLAPKAYHAYAWLLLRLIYLPGKGSSPYLALAKSPDILTPILESPEGGTRILGQKIKHALSLDSSDLHIDAEVKPGGRHDNDHADYREITIMPTTDELLSQERPFLRTADVIQDPSLKSSRHAIHLDNQFRLLREDMMGEIREEIQILVGTKPGRHKGLIVNDLRLDGVEMGTVRKRHPLGIRLQCVKELPPLSKIDPEKRRAYLRDNRHILRHGNMACLVVDNQPVAFPTIVRNEDYLAKTPATIVVQFQDDSALSDALLRMKMAMNIQLVQLDSAVFAFEPFLKRLQDMKELPLPEELLHWEEGQTLEAPSFCPERTIKILQSKEGKDLQAVLGTKTSIKLDESQRNSLYACLSQRVSLVLGPPGKSQIICTDHNYLYNE